MRSRMWLWPMLLVTLVAAALGIARAAPEPITLKVALYPYVPGRHAVFALLAREFQRANEGITLQLVEPNDYYDKDEGLLSLSADVYEVDSILLGEMVKAKKISPISISLEGFPPNAIEAVTRDGQIFAVPHWMCGNFLFYRKGDEAIETAATWADLVKVLRARRQALMVDFVGSLTLGEWYLTLLSDRIGLDAAQQAVLKSDVPDPDIVEDLKLILTACPTGYCRSRDYHDAPGYYARRFMRGQADVFLGYSESLHYALQEAINNCGPGSGCLLPDQIAVRRLPSVSAKASNEGIGWVDGLAIASGLEGMKRDAAKKFVTFATSPEGYAAVLQPLWQEAPRYLLPARTGIGQSESPLYPMLFVAHEGRKTGAALGLNDAVHALAGNLHCALPIDRTDFKSLAKCKKQ